jgi:zinc protease
VLLPLPEEPRVCLSILVRAGSAHDPSGKAGLARLTWSLLTGGGSRHRPVEEIERTFYPLALSLSLRLDTESVVFSATVPREDLERFYGIFREMLLDPGFREEDFERLKAVQIEALEEVTSGGADSALAREILNQMAFEDHPYGHPGTGTAASAAGLTLDDARAFYREHFVRGNIVIGLAGGYPADFPKRIAADFGNLPYGFTPRLVLPAPRRPGGVEFVLAEKPATATIVALGLPVDGAAAFRDRMSLAIAAAYLEGGPAGSLPKNPLRGGSGRLRLFTVELGPLTEAEGPAVIREALGGLAKLVEEGLPEEKFKRLRDSLLGFARLRARSLAEQLDLRLESHELGREDFEAEARDVLSKLSPDDVQAAVRKHLAPAGVFVAIVAPNVGPLKAALAAALNMAPETLRTAPAAAFFQKAGRPDR